jgi:ElaB/YqjD/DUF883 family membrane-anchored ribosome-binding protein
MNGSQNPEEAAQSGQEDLKSAAEKLGTAAAGKIEDLRETAGQKAAELHQAAVEKAKEASSAVEGAWSSTASKGKDWLAQAENYVRENPTQAVLIALGAGVFLGMCLRKS